MAGDLAHTPRSGLRAQLCGDAHMLNFRLLASPERRLMFDINDFDETLPGPWEWDVKRLAASLVIAGRANGFSADERAGVVRAAVGAYRRRMRGFAGMGNLQVWYTRFEADQLQQQFAPMLGGEDVALGACPRPGPGARHTAGLRQADAGDRRQTSDRPRSPVVAAAARPARRRRPRRPGEGDRPARRTVRPHPAARPPLPAGAVPARRLRAQGRRGRQCGYPLLDPAPARQGRRGSAVPAGEGGRGVGPGPVRGGGAVPFAGRAGGRRAAPDAGDQRHLPRLGAPVRRRRASARLLRAAVARLEGHRGGREPDPRHDDALR